MMAERENVESMPLEPEEVAPTTEPCDAGWECVDDLQVEKGLNWRVAKYICTACALMTLILQVWMVDVKSAQRVSEAFVIAPVEETMGMKVVLPAFVEEAQSTVEANQTHSAHGEVLEEGFGIRQRVGWSASATVVAGLNAFMLHTAMLRSDATQWEDISSWPTSLPMAVLAVLLTLMSLQSRLHEVDDPQARQQPVGLINAILAVFTVFSICKCISLPLDAPSSASDGQVVAQLVDSQRQIVLLIGISGLPALISVMMATCVLQDSDGLWCWPVVTIIAIMFAVWCAFVALYWKIKMMLETKSVEIGASIRHLQQDNGRKDVKRRLQKALALMSPEFWVVMMKEAMPEDMLSELKLMELYKHNVRLLEMLSELKEKYSTVELELAPEFKQPLGEAMSFVPEMIKLVVEQRFAMSSDEVLLPLET